jgi:hypothetical protein
LRTCAMNEGGRGRGSGRGREGEGGGMGTINNFTGSANLCEPYELLLAINIFGLIRNLFFTNFKFCTEIFLKTLLIFLGKKFYFLVWKI